MNHKGPLAEKSFQFAIDIVFLYKELIELKREFVMSKQLLRCGTAVGSQIREAQNAESKKDFVHKMAISQKECDESQYWLELLYATGYLDKEQFDHLIPKAEELMKMIKSTILTVKQRYRLT